MNHPHNVKPTGNELLLEPQERAALVRRRENALGHWARFSDDVLFEIIAHIDNPRDLLSLSLTCKVLYVYCQFDEFWKRLYLAHVARGRGAAEIEWRGSWRSTVLGPQEPQVPQFALENNLVCSDLLYRPFQCSQIDYASRFKDILETERQRWRQGTNDGVASSYTPVDRVPEREMSRERFYAEYIDTPFILTNAADTGSGDAENGSRWPQWTLDSLLSRFPQVQFQQEAVSWTLENYARYLRHNTDETPLYLFDCNSAAMQELCLEYTVPQIFKDDLFELFNTQGFECRPNYRWLIVGSKRTGSTFHKDPNATSAWNCVLSGCKIWLMLPPECVPPGVQVNEGESEVTSPVSLAEYVLSGFFGDCLKLSQNAQNRVLVGVTYPGECIYVPNNWWHLVINVEDGVALTQNFTPAKTLPKVLKFLKMKPDQISGLKLGKFKASVQKMVSGMPESERKSKLQAYLDLDVEECDDEDESSSNAPLYYVFEELLERNGFKDELALAKEAAFAKKDKKYHKENWHNFQNDTQTQFSFNFDLE